MNNPKTLSTTRIHGGQLLRQQHSSSTCNCEMTYSIFLPPQAERHPVPLVYWLSGLTCTDENFCQKSAAFGVASELGLALAMPDTSPRGEGVADEPGRYDLGTGAGFYVNATAQPWAAHYQMYDYITAELPAILAAHHPINEAQSIFGHSMGGHGALICALKNPGLYRSVSAFAPISSPSDSPWGRAIFSAYLGDNPANWCEWDANALVQKNTQAGLAPQPIFIDQGGADEFLPAQLQPQIFLATCQACNYPLDYRLRAGYDHSYYYIASFIDEHLYYHAQSLDLV